MEKRMQELEDRAKAESVAKTFGGGPGHMHQLLIHRAGDMLEVLEYVRELEGRLEAVCDVVSDAAAFGDDIPATRVLEAVRGERGVRDLSIGFDDVREGDLLRVSFPPRGGMSENWAIEHSRTGVACYKMDRDWLTSDGQVLVSGYSHSRAKIERLSGFGGFGD